MSKKRQTFAAETNRNPCIRDGVSVLTQSFAMAVLVLLFQDDFLCLVEENNGVIMLEVPESKIFAIGSKRDRCKNNRSISFRSNPGFELEVLL